MGICNMRLKKWLFAEMCVHSSILLLSVLGAYLSHMEGKPVSQLTSVKKNQNFRDVILGQPLKERISSTYLRTAFSCADPKRAKSCLTWLTFLAIKRDFGIFSHKCYSKMLVKLTREGIPQNPPVIEWNPWLVVVKTWMRSS